jgi:prevent-host-death family protein
VVRNTINAKDLRATLPSVVRRVRRGERITVLYRSRPAFRIVPVDDAVMPDQDLEQDPLFRAPAVGRSRDGRSAAEHDAALYGS